MVFVRKTQSCGWITKFILGLSLLLGGLVVIGCGEPTPNNTNNTNNTNDSWLQSTSPKAFVIGMLGESGSFGVIDVETLQYKANAGPVSNDAVARVALDHVFVINRLTHDNIQVMEQPLFSLKKQFSVGPQTNPQDIVVINKEKAYVSRLADSKLLVVHPFTGKTLGSIELKELAEVGDTNCQQDSDCDSKTCVNKKCTKDGVPEIATMRKYGNFVWVAVQRLNRNQRFAAEDNGLLAIIDTRTDSLVKTLPTTGKNPYQMQVVGKTLYVSQPGNWMEGGKVVLDGLIESYNLDTMEKSAKHLDETTLQGNIVSFAIESPSKGYVIRSGSNWVTELYRFHPGKGTLGPKLLASPCVSSKACYSFVSMSLHPSGKLFLVDRDAKSPGIRVIDTHTDKELTSKPIELGLPPMSVTFY